jgi:hypothetical protein
MPIILPLFFVVAQNAVFPDRHGARLEHAAASDRASSHCLVMTEF